MLGRLRDVRETTTVCIGGLQVLEHLDARRIGGPVLHGGICRSAIEQDVLHGNAYQPRAMISDAMTQRSSALQEAASDVSAITFAHVTASSIMGNRRPHLDVEL